MKLRGNLDFGALANKFDQMSGRSKESHDERFFVPGKDSEGNIAATIRFLPSPDSPPVMPETYHWFKGPSGKTYKENCPKADHKTCPACQFAGKAWGDGDQQAYKKWGNKTKYVANIAVINDINNPENNGKVFLFRFGATIYKMIDAKMVPKSQLQQASYVMDYKDGENFNLIGTKDSFKGNGGKMVEFDNFDQSAFIGKADSKLTDEQIQAFDEQLISMEEWNPENFYKSTDELKAKLEDVMELQVNGTPINTPTSPEAQKIDEEQSADIASLNKLINDGVEEESTSTVEDDDDDEDDLMARLSAMTDDD
jgi:hypothetical protein